MADVDKHVTGRDERYPSSGHCDTSWHDEKNIASIMFLA